MVINTSGFVAIPRGYREQLPFNDEPYTRREAFAWLLEQARYSEYKFILQGKVYHLVAGQYVASYRFLAEAWGWGKSGKDKVHSFLKLLARDGHIRLESKVRYYINNNPTPPIPVGPTEPKIITICNYEQFNKPIDRDVDSLDHSENEVIST